MHSESRRHRCLVEAHALLAVSALPHIGLAAVQHNADILIGKLYASAGELKMAISFPFPYT